MIKGSTRWVFIGRKRVYKIPSLYSWPHFLTGLLANLQEVTWSKMADDEIVSRICPVSFYVPFGFLVVMEKLPLLTDVDITVEELELLVETSYSTIPVEPKHNSFGKKSGKIVALDYGS